MSIYFVFQYMNTFLHLVIIITSRQTTDYPRYGGNKKEKKKRKRRGQMNVLMYY